MQPVTRALDRNDSRLREQPPDRGAAIIGHVIGQRAGQEQRRFVELAGPRQVIGPTDQLRHRCAQHLQVHPPARGIGFQVQRLQQKGADARLVHGFGQAAVGLGLAVDAGQVQPVHRVDQAGLRMAIADRRNVQNRQPTHRLRVGQRQRHRGLAAHRMARHVRAPAMISDDRRQIRRQCRIAVVGIGRAVTMIAHVDADDAPGFGQPPGNAAEVPALAEKPVRQQDRRTIAAAGFSDVQLHAVSLDRLARRCQRPYVVGHEAGEQSR